MVIHHPLVSLVRRGPLGNECPEYSPNIRRMLGEYSAPKFVFVLFFYRACAMTTNFLDNKSRTYKNLFVHGVSQAKQRVWTIFLSASNAPPPPQKRAKSPEIPQRKGFSGSEIAARNRKALATFHRTVKLQCSIAFSCLRNCCDFWGPRWALQSHIAKIAAISVR